jgi:hypothetical protein
MELYTMTTCHAAYRGTVFAAEQQIVFQRLRPQDYTCTALNDKPLLLFKSALFFYAA